VRSLDSLLHPFEMTKTVKTRELFYGVGSGRGVAICKADRARRGNRFHQRRIGLHQLRFLARSREDVDETSKPVERLDGARIVHGPQEDNFAPGYYSILFEHPDGIRLEVNYVPGKGHRDPNANIPLADTLSEG
jgi:hypothetical protein